nr:hypothetical protein [Moorena sp. SIO2C4]
MLRPYDRVAWPTALDRLFLGERISMTVITLPVSTLRTSKYHFLIVHGGNPQDRNGAFDLGELNSPRVAPLVNL